MAWAAIATKKQIEWMNQYEWDCFSILKLHWSDSEWMVFRIWIPCKRANRTVINQKQCSWKQQRNYWKRNGSNGDKMGKKWQMKNDKDKRMKRRREKKRQHRSEMLKCKIKRRITCACLFLRFTVANNRKLKYCSIK